MAVSTKLQTRQDRMEELHRVQMLLKKLQVHFGIVLPATPCGSQPLMLPITIPNRTHIPRKTNMHLRKPANVHSHMH